MNGIPMPPAQTPEMLQCHSKLMDENSPVKKQIYGISSQEEIHRCIEKLTR